MKKEMISFKVAPYALYDVLRAFEVQNNNNLYEYYESYVTKEDNLHQTADSMFENLGYEMKINKYLIYEKESSILTFSLEHKEYWHSDNTSVTIQEHLAIHQKMIELGWIE